MDIRRMVLAVLLTALGPRADCPAQQEFSFNPAVEKQFSDAVALFKNGKFDEAATMFDDLRRLKPSNQRTTAEYLMLSKSWFELRKYQQSALLLLEFLQRFPASTYGDDAYYTLGLDHMMEGQPDEAGADFLHGLERTDDPGLAQKSEKLFEYVADERLTVQGLQRLGNQPFQGRPKELIGLKLAQKYSASGDASRAKEILYGLVTAEKGNPYQQRARELLDELEREKGVRIAVVLPLMEYADGNPVKSLAGELLEGITFAMREQAAHPRSGPSASLEVRDSKRDSATALTAVREVASSSDVIGIVGPVFSNEVAACAPIANSSGIPVISPTATANGLASSGPYIFQLHADWSTRGKAMARYAVTYLGFSTLAVLSSADAPESLAARSFSEEARRLGANVVAAESFPLGASDLREQFLRIRRAAIGSDPEVSFAGKTRADAAAIVQAGADTALVDSLIARQESIGVTKLFGPFGRRIADSLHLSLIETDTISGNTDVAVTSIQGIFVAVDNAEEIGVIGSQLSYFNIKAQILGNEEWYDPLQLDIHKQYVNGAVFSSDFYADSQDSAYSRLDREFYSATARHPTKYTLIGYDTMKMLLDLVAAGAVTREKLAAALARLERYPLLHTTVTLTNGRVNSEVQILKYSDGRVKRIIDVAVN